jgi:rubrerythrin
MKKVTSFFCPKCGFSSTVSHSTCPACGAGPDSPNGRNVRYEYKGDTNLVI